MARYWGQPIGWAAFDDEAAVANAVPDEEDLLDWQFCHECGTTSRTRPCQECINAERKDAEAEQAWAEGEQAEADANAAALLAAEEEERRQEAEKEARKQEKNAQKAKEKAEKKAKEERRAHLKKSLTMKRIDDTDQEDW